MLGSINPSSARRARAACCTANTMNSTHGACERRERPSRPARPVCPGSAGRSAPACPLPTSSEPSRSIFGRCGARVSRHQHRGAQDRSGSEWQVDEEDQPPAAERMDADQQSADDRPEDGGAPITGPNQANAFGSSSRGKTARMIPRPCGSAALRSAPWASRNAYEHPGRIRDAATERADGEAGRRRCMKRSRRP